MSKPDLDDGWLKYAHELDAALAVADFTKGARIVLREVFAQIFGPAKAKSAMVSPAAVARSVGLRREAIARGLKELLDSHALELLEDGTYRFLKDYETWLRATGRPDVAAPLRLTPEEVAYCRFAPATAMAYKAKSMSTVDGSERINPVTEDPENRNQIDTKTVTKSARAKCTTVTKSARDRINLVTQNVTKSARASEAPPDPPHRNAPVRGDIKTGDRINTHTTRVRGAVSLNGAEPHDEPFVPLTAPLAPVHDTLTVTPEERAELDQAAALAERLFPMGGFGEMLSREPRPVDGMAVAWWSPALRKLAVRPKHQRTWLYLCGILGGFVREGGPPPEPRRGADVNPAALAETEATAETPEQREARLATLSAKMATHLDEQAERRGGRHAANR